MIVCLIYLLKIFIQITAVVLPSIIIKITEPVVYARVGTDWYVVQLHLQDILLCLANFEFVSYSSFVPNYCLAIMFKRSSLIARILSF